MRIKTLEQAEEVVASSSQLDWYGWDIVHQLQDDNAEYDIHGTYDRGTGKWFKRISYPYVNGTGWDIPNTLIKG